MAKGNHIFARATNKLLEAISGYRVGDELPSENALAKVVEASRATTRTALEHIEERGVVTREGTTRRLLRRPTKSDYFDDAELQSTQESIEQSFMQMVRDGTLKAGQFFSELEMARETGASQAAVREFLIHFSSYGLVEKQVRGGWVLRGFDQEYAIELADMRTLIETAALRRLAVSGLSATDEKFLDELIHRHEVIANDLTRQQSEFPQVDRSLHEWLVSKLGNRFATQLLTGVSFIFHYHYQVDRRAEQALNQVAIQEHLDFLRTVRSGNFAAAIDSLSVHLDTSKDALVRTMIEPGRAPQSH